MNRAIRVCAAGCALVLAAGATQACAQLSYSATAIHGVIIDADSAQPLEGVNVVAQWKIDRAMVGDDKALLYVAESVTDKDGKYSFPSWGPITLPERADFRQGRDPLLSLFKSGYEPAYLDNGVVSDIRYRLTPVGEFKWNGAITKLKKWRDDLRTYARRVASLASGLPHATGKEWRSYPRMLLALDRENNRLVSLGYPQGSSVPGVHIDRLDKEDLEYLNRHSR